MRKTKVYRPRRGLRLSKLPRGGPPAGFVAGPSSAISPVTVGASLQDSLVQSAAVDDTLSGSVSYGMARQSRLLNNTLLGIGNQGSGRPYSPVVAAVTASVPSWANSGSAFVIQSLNAIGDGPVHLNYYLSGTAPVESAAVPASCSLHFSKNVRYNTLIVKKTASFFDTVVPFSGAIVPSAFASGTGSLITIVTGSNTPSLSCSYRYPATIRIDVPQRGRLVDLRVWVEIVHLSGSPGRQHPLSTLGIALRSPNVRWGHAHPVRNDPKFITAFHNPTFVQLMILGSTNMEDLFYPPANFYRDTFLLWEGIGIADEGSGRGPQTETHGAGTTLRPNWDRDRGMRTIFADGAPVRNPRHLGDSSPSGSNFVGAPNAAFGINHAFGMDVPWTSDKTIFPATESYQAVGSPPKGWLTGPASTADVNEWPTTGVNYGTNLVRPIYPMLEGIYQRKSIGTEVPLIGSIVKSFSGVDFPQEDPGIWNGFRPGLRGTEINGTWELLIAQAGSVGSFGANESTRVNAYFRQVRLEFIYETGVEPEMIRAVSHVLPRRSGDMFYGAISGSGQMFRDDGSGSWDGYISRQVVSVPGSSEIGRTFGIRLNTGSFDSSQFALIYRLTGTLADKSGSAPGWLLNNEFGVPAIPVSSASIVPYVPYSTPPVVPMQTFVVPTKSLDGARRLADVVADLNPPRTLADLAIEFVSSSLS